MTQLKVHLHAHEPHTKTNHHNTKRCDVIYAHASAECGWVRSNNDIVIDCLFFFYVKHTHQLKNMEIIQLNFRSKFDN